MWWVKPWLNGSVRFEPKPCPLLVPAPNKWSVCFEPRLQAHCKSYSMFENQCNQYDAHSWEEKLVLFNARVTQVLVDRVKV